MASDANLGYLIAGYAITWVALAAYAWRLVRRTGEARRSLAEAPPRARGATGVGPGATDAAPGDTGVGSEATGGASEDTLGDAAVGSGGRAGPA